jgi:ketosteroid isomerase-like protein
MVAGANIQIEEGLREEVERFFAGYRDAYNAADPAAVARHFAVPSLLVQRETTLWSADEAVLQAMTELVAFYAKSGFHRAHFTVEQVVPQGEDHAVAGIAWAIERSEGRPAWNFHTGYNLRRDVGGAWRIVCCTAYEEVGVRQRTG